MIKAVKRFIKQNILQHYWNNRGSFTYYDQQIYFPKDSVIYKRAINAGIYEHDVVAIILPLIKPQTTVFDIGANIGLMAMPMLKHDDSIKVISVEASPNSTPFLLKTQQASNYKIRWTIIDKAVSEKEGKINFHIAAKGNGAYDSMNDTSRIDFVGKVEIDCTTIDKIWESQHKPDVSFIKIDIEGADLLALKGGKVCIDTCKPSILLEWNPTNIKPFQLKNTDLFDFITGMNYVLYALPALNKISTLNDLELLSNYTENFLMIYNR